MDFEFIPLDFDYFDFEDKNYIKLIGRTAKKEKVCVIDSYEPNFWIILKEGANPKRVLEKASDLKIHRSGRESRVLKTEICDKKFLGKKVKAIKVFVTNHKDLHDMASEFGEMKEIEVRREFDIGLITKYIKEKKIESLKWYTVSGNILGEDDFGGISKGLDLKYCLMAEKIVESKKQEEYIPKVLAYDIETNDFEMSRGKILMIALYGKNFKKVLSWNKTKSAQDYVEFFKSEAEMLEGFSRIVKEYDADILTGYFSDGFDLPYIATRAKKLKVKLEIGLDGNGPSFSRGRIASGKISGIVHVDIFRFISAVYSQYLKSETLSLNDVSKELIGESKEDFDFSKLKEMTEEDWKDFFSYNLQDTAVTYKLFEKIWPDILEFSRIVKEPLFNVTRDRMATMVENYILHNLDLFNEIAEKRPGPDEIGRRRAMEKFEGAFVYEPKPGIYEDVVMFDFTSMYSSVIVSYNLSKSTYLGKDKFSKEEGFFPKMLSEIIEKRKKHKKEYAKNQTSFLRARSNAYKLLANASYGYQAYFGGRYYCREAAAATARYARDNIKKTIKDIEKRGYQILYGDTDSIAFSKGKKSKKEILEFLKELNDNLPGIMELDLEDFYKRGIFVSMRGKEKETGAKKKYSLLSEDGNIKIVGFEAVRRDWCKLVRRLQKDVLRMVLEDGNEKRALELLKRTVEKLKKGEVEISDLIIRTQLRRAITAYVSRGPHVIAAEKMKKRGLKVGQGSLIDYYIGKISGKGKLVRDKVFLVDEKADYDVDYYLNKQVLSAVESIFDVFGIDVVAIIDGEKQEKLF